MLVQRDRRQRTDIAVEDGSTRTSTVATPVRGIREIRGALAHPARGGHGPIVSGAFGASVLPAHALRCIFGILGFLPYGRVGRLSFRGRPQVPDQSQGPEPRNPPGAVLQYAEQ